MLLDQGLRRFLRTLEGHFPHCGFNIYCYIIVHNTVYYSKTSINTNVLVQYASYGHNSISNWQCIIVAVHLSFGKIQYNKPYTISTISLPQVVLVGFLTDRRWLPRWVHEQCRAEEIREALMALSAALLAAGSKALAVGEGTGGVLGT